MHGHEELGSPVLDLLTGHHPAELAIHVDSGLMVGLTGDDIGQILLTHDGPAWETVEERHRPG